MVKDSTRLLRKNLALAVLFSFIVYLLTAFICSLAIALFPSGKEIIFITAFMERLTGDLSSTSLSVALISLLFAIFFVIFDWHKSYLNNFINQINNKEIVLIPGMDGFDIDHIVALEQILLPNYSKEKGPNKTIIAFDASQPNKWWLGDMIGYLALQRRWKAEHLEREVVRVFIWGRDKVISKAGKKLLTLHKMMGFRTIICHPNLFIKLAGNDNLMREFLIWDDDNAEPSMTAIQIGTGTFGFESFWKTYHEQEERDKIAKDRIMTGNVMLFNKIDKKQSIEYRKIYYGINEIIKLQINQLEANWFNKYKRIMNQFMKKNNSKFIIELKSDDITGIKREIEGYLN